MHIAAIQWKTLLSSGRAGKLLVVIFACAINRANEPNYDFCTNITGRLALVLRVMEVTSGIISYALDANGFI